MASKIIPQILFKYAADLIPSRKKRKAFKAYIKAKYSLGLEEKEAVYADIDKYYRKLYVALKPNYDAVDVSALPIWQLWLQGRNQAPRLVEKCFSSVAKYSQGRSVNVLTAESVRDYIDLPDIIWNKYNNGKGVITHAHFSDIVRTCLLAKYGGTWIDATILLTDNIPQKILEQPFFAYEPAKNEFYSKIHIIDSWFLHARPQHVFMRNLERILCAYWDNENELKDYFLFHMLFTGMLRQNADLYALYEQGLHVDYTGPLALSRNFLEPFDAKKLEAIKQVSVVHKLTYFNKYYDRKDTFLYEFLNNNELF